MYSTYNEGKSVFAERFIRTLKKKQISKTNLASLKTEVDKLDIPELSTVPADLAKLTNKVANDLVEETDFNASEKK